MRPEGLEDELDSKPAGKARTEEIFFAEPRIESAVKLRCSVARRGNQCFVVIRLREVELGKVDFRRTGAVPVQEVIQELSCFLVKDVLRIEFKPERHFLAEFDRVRENEVCLADHRPAAQI